MKLRPPREVKSLPQAGTAGKGQSWDSNPGRLVSGSFAPPRDRIIEFFLSLAASRLKSRQRLSPRWFLSGFFFSASLARTQAAVCEVSMPPLSLAPRPRPLTPPWGFAVTLESPDLQPFSSTARITSACPMTAGRPSPGLQEGVQTLQARTCTGHVCDHRSSLGQPYLPALHLVPVRVAVMLQSRSDLCPPRSSY